MEDWFQKSLLNMGKVVLVTIIIAVFNLLWAWPTVWAWNYVIPYIFGLPEIGYWQAWCLLFVLTSLWKITPVSTS